MISRGKSRAGLGWRLSSLWRRHLAAWRTVPSGRTAWGREMQPRRLSRLYWPRPAAELSTSDSHTPASEMFLAPLRHETAADSTAAFQCARWEDRSPAAILFPCPFPTTPPPSSYTEFPLRRPERRLRRATSRAATKGFHPATAQDAPVSPPALRSTP